jgi:hypothetical protein
MLRWSQECHRWWERFANFEIAEHRLYISLAEAELRCKVGGLAPPKIFELPFTFNSFIWGPLQVFVFGSQVLVFDPPKIFCLRLLKQNKFLLSNMKLSHFFMCLETRVHEKEDCRLRRALLKVYVLQQKLFILLQTFGHIRLRICHVNFLLNFNFYTKI